MPKLKSVASTRSVPAASARHTFDDEARTAGSQQQYPAHHPYAAAPARETIEVHDHDVLNGRGVNMAHHPGNERFRSLIQSRSDPSYCANYSLNEKKALAEEVVRHIEALDPPGRFLKRSGKTKNKRGLQGPWELMTREEAVKKARQALRDCNRPDRNGYAKSVSAPVDVLESAMVRKSTGLSQQQYAQQLAAATETAAESTTTTTTANARRGSGSRTPNSEASKGGSSTHTNIQSPVPTSPFRPPTTNSNNNVYTAPPATYHWAPDSAPPSSAETARDVSKSRDTSQDTPTLMNSTPSTAATSGGLFSADDFADSHYHHHHHHHNHDGLDVSNAPGLDSPTHHSHFGHSLPPSPSAHGVFEEALANIHAEDDKAHGGGSALIIDPQLQQVADHDAALSGEFEADFAATFDGENHTF